MPHSINVFDPELADEMSEAVRTICEACGIDDERRADIARRVIAYANAGVKTARELRDLVMQEHRIAA